MDIRRIGRDEIDARIARFNGLVIDIGAKSAGDSYSEVVAGDCLTLDIAFESTLDIVGDGRQLPFQDDVADGVILAAVLEHVKVQDQTKLLEECYRVLRPGGELAVMVPFSHPLHKIPHDYCRYTPYGLAAILEEIGFTIVDVYRRGSYSSHLGATLAYPIRVIGRFFGFDTSRVRSRAEAAFDVLGKPFDILLRRLRGRNLISERLFNTTVAFSRV